MTTRTELTAVVVSVLMALTSCSTQVSPPGLRVICHTDVDCPTEDEVYELLELFRDMTASTFDVDNNLDVHWRGQDEDLGTSYRGGRILGYTVSPSVVHTTSLRILVHEVMHVHLWRMFPESGGDGTHEEPPGPWTSATTEAVRAVAIEGEY